MNRFPTDEEAEGAISAIIGPEIDKARCQGFYVGCGTGIIGCLIIFMLAFVLRYFLR